MQRLIRHGVLFATLTLAWLQPTWGQSVDDYRPRTLMKPLPPITDAPTVAADQAKVGDNDLVIGVVVDGQARAYPINQLTGPRREIINDLLAGTAIAATW